jgi:hypothetical protein
MEELIALVAASFARHGIECTPRDASSESPAGPLNGQAMQPAEPTALPEHNFRKSLQGDPAP